MAKKNKPPKWKIRGPKVARAEAAKRDPATGATLCSCGCKQPAEIVLGGELAYTRACMQRTIDEVRAAGIPIEQTPEGGVRLRPGTQVTIVDDGDPTKVH